MYIYTSRFSISHYFFIVYKTFLRTISNCEYLFLFLYPQFSKYNYTNLIRSSGGGLALRRDIPSRDASSFSVSSGSDVMRDDWAFPLAVYGSSNRGCKFSLTNVLSVCDLMGIP